MKIENNFSVPLPADEVYELLLDLERVAPCVPGAELGERQSDGSHLLAIKVKLGPMRFTYAGAVRVAEQVPETRRAVLVGEARETRGQGTASATITMTVEQAEASSSVTTVADVQLTGRAAQMGHGVVASVAQQLIADMAGCLEQRFAAEAGSSPAAAVEVPAAPPAKPVGVLRLLLRAMARSLGRLLRRDRSGP
jgi:uncharacterized protein